jgi:hypothetical protein
LVNFLLEFKWWIMLKSLDQNNILL